MRALWQVVADLVAIGTIVAAVWISQQVRDAIASLGVFGTQIEDAGTGFSTTLTDAGEALAQVPFVGEGIAQPFVEASGSADDLAAAGVALRSAVDALATAVGTALWLLPVLLLVLIWLIPRLRFATRAGASKRFAATREGRDLLALRTADQPSLDALAALELRSAGVRARTP